MKVAINKCWGGFGLSHEAIMLYAKFAGFKLYPFIDKRGTDGSLLFNKFLPYVGQKDVFLIHYSKKPLTKSGTYVNDSYFSDRDIERTDPLLIKVIEKLHTKANGQHAKIRIVEIPDGTKWELDEYDGQESIHEVHRSWG